MADDKVHSGHTSIFGQDTATDPSALGDGVAAKAVNRIFRGGENLTRPGFLHRPFAFFEDTIAESDYQTLIATGNFQGWFPYRKRKPGREDGIIVSIAGNIFFLVLVNEKFYARFVFGGNNPKLQHCWFEQVEEWVYINDGESRPIFWNGLFPATARRSRPEDNEMPAGTLLKEAHGRVFLTNAFNQILASDILFGNGLTKSDGVQKFTEATYWAGGGYFSQPAELGDITGMAVVARQDDKLNGRGELVIISEKGASALDASISRSLWQSQNIQTMTLQGRGCVAPASLIVVNNDLWFRSNDGIASYQLSRAEEKRQPSFGKISRDVNLWVDTDTPWLLRFAAMTYFDNRIIATVSPMIQLPANTAYGTHRFHRGMVVLDLDQSSRVKGDSSFNWDGLWTGIRPCDFVQLGKQCFAFSFDEDGMNRIYEISRDSMNDEIDGERVQIKWHYLTKSYSWLDTQTSTQFDSKQLLGGEIFVSDVRDIVTFGVDYRTDEYPYWTQAMGEVEFGSFFGNEVQFTYPRFKNFPWGNPKRVCLPEGRQSDHAFEFQFMVYGRGHLRVNRLRAAANRKNDQTVTAPNCKDNNEKISIDNSLKMEDDYSYSIVTSR